MNESQKCFSIFGVTQKDLNLPDLLFFIKGVCPTSTSGVSFDVLSCCNSYLITLFTRHCPDILLYEIELQDCLYANHMGEFMKINYTKYEVILLV